jgi:hypothetical protein
VALTRDAVQAWLDEPDDPGSWEAGYRPLLFEAEHP